MMPDRIALFTQGGGIGDAIHLASAVEAFVTSDPSREYGAMLSGGANRSWWEAAFADAPFPTWLTWPSNAWRATRCAPIRIGSRESVVDAHVRAAQRKAGIGDFQIKRPRLGPAWFGPRPPIEPERVGVFSPLRSKTKFWPASAILVDELRRRGIRAEPTPVFDDPLRAVEWIARCAVFVGAETGLTHLAAALGVPTVLILGGRFAPSTFPWPGMTHVTSDCPEGPCFFWRHEHPPPCLRRGVLQVIPCLVEISVERVADEVVARAMEISWKM